MTSTLQVPDTDLGRVVMERIANLRKWRHWYQAQPDPTRWADLARQYEVGAVQISHISRGTRWPETTCPIHGTPEYRQLVEAVA